MVQSLIPDAKPKSCTTFECTSAVVYFVPVPRQSLRALLYSHIINDVKRLNEKSNNVKVNKQLQNFLYKMLNDNRE